MRIISGKCKGKKLSAISGWDIRPTSDRVREAIFNIISHDVKGKIILDLFAGTGALGLEALSRGAKYAFFMDSSEYSMNITKQNAVKCNFTDRSEFICMDILQNPYFPSMINRKINIVFMDPPYNSGFISMTLQQPGLQDCLADNALIIAEHSKKEKIEVSTSGFELKDQRKYSRTLVSFFKKV